MALLMWILLMATMMAASFYLMQYLVRLPFAPECPTCKCVTSQPRYITRFDRMLAQRGVSLRSCPRCGWAGRMRWRLAEERAGTGRGGRE